MIAGPLPAFLECLNSAQAPASHRRLAAEASRIQSKIQNLKSKMG